VDGASNLAEVIVSDPLAEMLAAIARAVYPTVAELARDPTRGALFTGLHAAYWRSGWGAEFCERALADPLLAGVFHGPGRGQFLRPAEYHASIILGPVYLTDGYLTGRQLAILGVELLGHATRGWLVDGTLTEEAYVQRARAAVYDFRSLMSGEEILVTTVYGFTGVEIPEGTSISLPFGVLRSPLDTAERGLLHAEVLPETSVFISTVGLRAFPGDDATEMFRVHGAPARQAADDAARKAALAVTLAVERDPPVGVAQAWSMMLTPWAPGLARTGNQPGLTTPYRVNAADAEAIATMSRLIGTHYHERLGIAARRCLSALGERRHPTDSLIDAMISLESLFTPASHEISFQLAASLSLLLEKDEGRRKAMFKHVKDLYGTRSRILHGGDDPSVPNVLDDSIDAATLAVRALRTLFLERPDLITADDRVRRLVLQDRPPNPEG